MIENLPPEAHLFKPVTPAKFPGRTRLQIHVVVVVVAPPPVPVGFFRRFLFLDVRPVLLGERAAREPGRAPPPRRPGGHRARGPGRGSASGTPHARRIYS